MRQPTHRRVRFKFPAWYSTLTCHGLLILRKHLWDFQAIHNPVVWAGVCYSLRTLHHVERILVYRTKIKRHHFFKAAHVCFSNMNSDAINKSATFISAISMQVKRHAHNLPLVFKGTSLRTSMHQLSFLWRSSEVCVAWSVRAFWSVSRNWGQNWHILNISMVYLCIVLKWWIIPLGGLTRSSGVLSLIFMAFSILLWYKAWGRMCWPAMFLEDIWNEKESFYWHVSVLARQRYHFCRDWEGSFRGRILAAVLPKTSTK